MNINISAVTDVGIERSNNEDAVVVCPDLGQQSWKESCNDDSVPLGKNGTLLVVADGMGGANAGEVASSLAVNTVRSYFSAERLDAITINETTVRTHLVEAIHLSNQAIIDSIVTNPDSDGLGTTVVIAWVAGDTAYIAWCGDSRCYCFNPNKGLKQLTKDHSYVQELIDKGEIFESQAFNHPDGNIITRYLGDADSEPEVVAHKIENGDCLLVCTDGLCGYCRDSAIEKVMYDSFQNICQCRDNLLKLALNAGGQDNVTIVLCSIYTQNNDAFHIGLKGKIRRFFSQF